MISFTFLNISLSITTPTNISLLIHFLYLLPTLPQLTVHDEDLVLSPWHTIVIFTACPAEQLFRLHLRLYELHPPVHFSKTSPGLHFPIIMASLEYRWFDPLPFWVPDVYPIFRQNRVAPNWLSQNQCPQIGSHLSFQKRRGVPSFTSITSPFLHNWSGGKGGGGRMRAGRLEKINLICHDTFYFTIY